MAETSSRRHSSVSSLHPEESHNSRDSDSLINGNVFSDENALEPPEVSSASETSSPAEDRGSHNSVTFNIPRRPLGSQTSNQTPNATRLSRNSIGYGSNSSSRNGRPSSFSNAPVGSVLDGSKPTSMPYRSISNSSNFSMPRSQSPYQGATAPSHPYGMYPQDVGIVRSSSSSTNQTRIGERFDRYTGPTGPMQPYEMYSQNTVPEEPVDSSHPMPGFPGLTRNYQRRFAPDGEEAADIVGPDGYTEQLPPYTRYANDIQPTRTGPENHGRDQSVEGETRNQSMGSETINQPASSQDTLTASNPGAMRNFAVDDSLTQLNPPSSETSDASGHSKERVKGRGTKRICYGKLPVWLVMVFIFVGAVLLGAVIGGVLGHAKGAEDHPHPPMEIYPESAPTTTSVTTTTTLIDAVPFTSSGVPSIPTGSFSIDLDQTTATFNSTDCLDDTQSTAWACSSGAHMNITVMVDKDNITSVSFSSVPISSTETYRYGPQPPQFDGLSNVAIMKDRDDPDEGPAYFIQRAFDKLVILRDTEFSMIHSKRSFNAHNDHAVLNSRDDNDDDNAYAQVGENPWFCFWNGTLLEVFIFVSQDSTSPDSSISTSTTDARHWVTAIPSAGNVFSIPTFLNSGNGVSKSTATASAGNAFSIPTSIPTPRSWPRFNPMPSSMDYYPKVVKMEERRNSDNEIQPYCQKMQIMNDGSASPVDDRQELDENEPSGMKRREWFGRLGFGRKRDLVKGCQCNWING